MDEQVAQVNTQSSDVSQKSRLTAFLLAFFLGGFGTHRFYVGKVKSGLVMLILTITIIGAIITVIWATIDWIMILVGGFLDKDNKKLKNW